MGFQLPGVIERPLSSNPVLVLHLWLREKYHIKILTHSLPVLNFRSGLWFRFKSRVMIMVRVKVKDIVRVGMVFRFSVVSCINTVEVHRCGNLSKIFVMHLREHSTHFYHKIHQQLDRWSQENQQLDRWSQENIPWWHLLHLATLYLYKR